MRHDDDYTPENVSGAKISGSTVFGICLIAILLTLAVIIALGKKDDHIVIDRETVSTVTREPIPKFLIDDTYFYAGDILTSKENGSLMLWDTSMPLDWIIGIVSDSGTIETYRLPQKYIHVIFALPENYKEGTEIHPHIHWIDSAGILREADIHYQIDTTWEK